MAALHHHSLSSDHEPLLRDFKGQENDHERQEEDLYAVENEKSSEDGGEKRRGIHIYPGWLAGRSRKAHLEAINSKHQDPRLSASGIGGTKKVSPYSSYSVPLFDVQVRRFCLFILHQIFPPPYLYSLHLLHLLLLLFRCIHAPRFLSFTGIHSNKHLPSTEALLCPPPSLLF
jgi:hypothetical protein